MALRIPSTLDGDAAAGAVNPTSCGLHLRLGT